MTDFKASGEAKVGGSFRKYCNNQLRNYEYMRGNSRRPHELQGSNGNGITRIGNLAVKGEESYINNDTKSNIN